MFTKRAGGSRSVGAQAASEGNGATQGDCTTARRAHETAPQPRLSRGPWHGPSTRALLPPLIEGGGRPTGSGRWAGHALEGATGGEGSGVCGWWVEVRVHAQGLVDTQAAFGTPEGCMREQVWYEKGWSIGIRGRRATQIVSSHEEVGADLRAPRPHGLWRAELLRLKVLYWKS